MNIDSGIMVPIAEANENFSEVVRLVDESGMVVIMKNNKPCYMVLNFFEYNEIQTARRELIANVTDSVITENLEALRELAK